MNAQKPRYFETPARTVSGYLMTSIAVLGLALAVFLVLSHAVASLPGVLLMGALIIGALLIILGIYTLQPNEAANLTLFGAYAGTDRQAGLRWANPFCQKQKNLAAFAQLERPYPEGQRQARQPRGDWCRGGLVCARHRTSNV